MLSRTGGQERKLGTSKEKWSEVHKGSERYFVGNLVRNFGSMYVKGDAVVTAIQLIPLFVWFAIVGDPTSTEAISQYIERVIMTLVPNPDWMFLNVIINPLVGAGVSTLKWSNGMHRR